MNIRTKIISLSAASIITLTFAGQCFASEIPFTDLANVTAKDKIFALQDNGYIKGIGDGLFAPNDTVTAAQGVQLIVNALKLNLDTVRFAKEPKATDYFVKANDDEWYANALIIASVNGLELPSDLDPDKEWTREEFTYNLIKAMEKHSNLPMINIVPADIADQDQLTIEYSGAIQRALVYGVAALDAEGKICPKEKISRAQAAEAIYNALEYLKNHPAPVME